MRVMAPKESATAPADLGLAPLFRTLDDQQRAQVIEQADFVDVAAGETIVEEGTPADELFVLLRGEANVLVRGADGELIEVGSLDPGDSFGELGALLREPRAATIVAAEPSRLLRLSDRALAMLLERIGPLGLALARNLARHLEEALGQRNALQTEGAPDRVVVPMQDLSQVRAYQARYLLSTVRNLVKRNRLLTAPTYPSYVTEFKISKEDEERWYEFFGLPVRPTWLEGSGQVRVPFTYHVSAWTLLLMQLLEDLGVNFRELSHLRSKITYHPDRPFIDTDTVYGLQVNVTGTSVLADDRVAVLTETRVTGKGSDVTLSASDVFLITGVDRAVVKRLRKSGPKSDGNAVAPELRPPALDPKASGAVSIPLRLTEDIGSRYGRLSGNLNPVHTTRAAARLLGFARPHVQHMCVANLVVRHLTEQQGAPPQRLDLTFLRPVYVDQTVEIRLQGEQVEIVDAENHLLVAGEQLGRGAVGTRTSPAPATAPAPAPAPRPPAPREVLRVDPEALRRVLEPDHHELRERIRALLVDERLAVPDGLSKDAYRTRVLEWARVLAADGIGALAYPVDCGGKDDPGAAIAAFETLAFGDLSLLIKHGVQFGLFGGAILNLGTKPHHDRYLRDVGTLDLPGCFALTEKGHGSDARSIRTTATWDQAKQEFVINTPDDEARKDYIGNSACHGRMAALFARLFVAGEDHGVHAFLVPIRKDDGTPAPGVRIGDCGTKLGLNGVDNGRLWFDDVRVPREALLNRYGNVSVDGRYSSPLENPSVRFFTMLATLVSGRVSIGLGSLTASKCALAVAVRYALRRRQFAPPKGPEILLLDYVTHQRRLLPALATTFVFSIAMKRLVDDYVRILRSDRAPQRERMQLETLAAGLKSLSSWHGSATIQACREACGGAGYLAINKFAALKADTDVFTTFEGDNTVLLQLVAKTLITDYKQQFEDMDFGGMVRFLLGQVVAAIVPAPPSRASDTAHLRSSEFQLQAFRSREDLRIADLGRRLKRAIDRGMDGHSAFMRYQDRALKAASAHVERVALERVTEIAGKCDDPDVRAVVTGLKDLFALWHLELDRGWFLENRLFAGVKTQAISREVNALCRELRPVAGELVQAFGVPEPLLVPTIAG